MKIENPFEDKKWIFIECLIETFCNACQFLENDLKNK